MHTLITNKVYNNADKKSFLTRRKRLEALYLRRATVKQLDLCRPGDAQMLRYCCPVEILLFRAISHLIISR